LLAIFFDWSIKLIIETGSVIEPKVFKEFAAAGSIKNASIRVVDHRLVVVLRIGSMERVLGQHRGGARFFQSFDGAAALLRQNGILKWDADTTGWTPRTARQK
jgi:hypothetical protein